MPDYKHINSASRIHALLTEAVQQPDKATWGVWADVFGVKGTDDTETAELVLERLHWLQIELQLLRTQADGAALSKHLYDGSLSRIRSVISPLNLPAGWQGVRGNLTPDVLLALAFLNEVLPDEESAIPAAELQAIAKQVAELADALKAADLPPALRRLVEHHINLIATALAQYRIAGARGLREAGRTALGEIIERKDELEPEKKSEVVSRLGKLWKHVNSAADAALKAEKLAQLGHRAWEAVSGLLQ
jgi:hypothetical protein